MLVEPRLDVASNAVILTICTVVIELLPAVCPLAVFLPATVLPSYLRNTVVLVVVNGACQWISRGSVHHHIEDYLEGRVAHDFERRETLDSESDNTISFKKQQKT
jgi:hypothetical protein